MKNNNTVKRGLSIAIVGMMVFLMVGTFIPTFENVNASSMNQNTKLDTNYTIAYYDFTSMTIGEINKTISRYNPPTDDAYNYTSYGWWNTTISKDSEGLNITTHVHSNDSEMFVLCPWIPYPKSTLEIKYKWSSWQYNQLTLIPQTITGSSTKRAAWSILELIYSIPQNKNKIKLDPGGDYVYITRGDWHILKIELKDCWNINATIDQNVLYDGTSYGDYDDIWYHLSAPQYLCALMSDPNSDHSQNSYLNVEYIKQYTNRSLITPIIHKFASIGFDIHNTSESNSWSLIDYLLYTGCKGTLFLDISDDYDYPKAMDLINNEGWELGWHGDRKWVDIGWNLFKEDVANELNTLKNCYGKYPTFHSCLGNGENKTHAKYIWDNHGSISRNFGFQSDFVFDEWFTNPNYFPAACRAANMSISWFAYTHGNSSTADYCISDEDFQYLVDLLLENGYSIMPYADAYFMARNTIDATFTNIDFTTSKYSFKANTNGYESYVDIYDYYNLSDSNSIVFAVDNDKAITQFETSSPHSALDSFNIWVEDEQIYNIYKMSAVPDSGLVYVTLNTFNLAKKDVYDEIVVSFKASSTDGNNVEFTLEGLSPDKTYQIKKDGVFLSSIRSDATGMISFNNSDWSEHTFTVINAHLGDMINPLLGVVITVMMMVAIISMVGKFGKGK